MSGLEFRHRAARGRFGLKGPAAAAWLAGHGIGVPSAANSWVEGGGAPDGAILVARLGTGEFFLEDRIGGTTLAAIGPKPEAHPPGVYPVLREDAGFLLHGDGSLDVLAQVCNVNFGELDLESHPVIMTSMIGVSVLVVPQASAGGARYRIWCDPTFGAYLGESVGAVVRDCGGNITGESA